MGRPAGDAGPGPLARAPRRPLRAALAHTDRLQQGTAATRRVPRIYAPGTRQNRSANPGLYRFNLAHSWSTTLLDDGPYRLEVEATDLRGNIGSLRLPFTTAP